MSVPRVYDSGVYRDATKEEIAAWEQSMSDTPAPEPTAEDRIAALEERVTAINSAFSEFKAKLKYLNL